MSIFKRAENPSKVTESKDPCSAEGAASKSCMSKNNYDQNACAVYFKNYNTCKKFWLEVKRTRNNKGLSPSLPPMSERDSIKKENMATYKATGKTPYVG